MPNSYTPNKSWKYTTIHRQAKHVIQGTTADYCSFTLEHGIPVIDKQYSEII